MIFDVVWVYRTMVGHLGWLNVPLPLFAYVIPVFGCLFMFLARPGAEKASSGKDLVLTMLLVVGSAALIHVAMYVYWTRAGLDAVQGVQGRYMLPLLAVFLLALHRATPGGAARYRAAFRFGFAAACTLNLGITIHTVTTEYRVF